MQMYRLAKLVLATTALSSVLLASAATVAGAADVPPPAYKLPPPPYFTWTGFYVGAHIGGGWFDVSDGFGDSVSMSGFVGGGQVGYNYQIGHWVWGGELEVSGTSIGTSSPFGSFSVDSVTTLAARGGYAFDRWLVYGKAGAGWISSSANAFGFGSVSGTTSAAIFGVGAEYALGHNWSAKVEYNYFDLGSDSFGGSSSFQTLKAGVNYRFQGWPY